MSRPGEEILNRAGIPTFPLSRHRRARLLLHVAVHATTCAASTRRPRSPRTTAAAHVRDARARRLIARGPRAAAARSSTEVESKQLLAAYGIPTVETRVAPTPRTRSRPRDEIGYPVVLKLYSRDDHAQDRRRRRAARTCARAEAVRGGVRTTSQRPSRAKAGAEHFQGVTVQPMVAHRTAYELIVGSSIDPQFGPVLLFGTGGAAGRGRSRTARSALPPLNTTLARRMMEQTQIFTALQGVRGRKPVDLAALEQLLVRFSQLVVEQPRDQEIDINPLLASRRAAARARRARGPARPEVADDEAAAARRSAPYPIAVRRRTGR